MYKLIFILMCCLWSVNSDVQECSIQTKPESSVAGSAPEVLEFLNPFFQFSH
jgi:hypothetical protein